jgi:hypothetical protein
MTRNHLFDQHRRFRLNLLRTRRQARQGRHLLLSRKLYVWKLSVLQSSIAARLASVTSARLDVQSMGLAEFVLQQLVWFCSQSDKTGAGRRMTEMMDAIREAGGEAVTSSEGDSTLLHVLQSLATIGEGRDGESPLFVAICRTLGKWWLHSCEDRNSDMTPDTVEHAARQLGFDIVEKWELSRYFLSIHSLDELKALAKEWSCKLDSADKSAVIAEMLSKCSGKSVPKTVRTLKAVAL